MKFTRFGEIPQLTRGGFYQINVGWDYLERHIAGQMGLSPATLDLDPDFQRGYVWTQKQKTAYVEYILRGGKSGRDLYFNCVGWMRENEGPYVIVDGKQRLEAVRGFLRDEVRAFGSVFREYTDKLRLTGPDFIWHVNNLASRADVLQWYIEMNTGGTVHTDGEIKRVRKMIEKERAPPIRR